jgi:ectoine hydroxylase-related dioxygenase (phytanoyl-CoA dioxygenase family)
VTIGETMSIEEALRELGVGPTTLSDDDRARLDRDGYAVFPGLLDPATIEEVRAAVVSLEDAEGAWDRNVNPNDPGAARVDDVNHKGVAFDRLWVHPVLLACMHHYLGDFRLSSVTSRAARPGTGHQRMHVDWWGEIAEGSVACNSCWLLDDFTVANGATRIVPGSHRSGSRPEDAMADPLARHPDEVIVEAPAGSLAVFNGYVWHSGTENTTDRPRRGLFTVYSRADQPRQNDQAAVLDEATAARLSPAARRILDV